VFTKDGIRTLGNVFIVDPTPKDLLLQSCTTQEFVAFHVTQVKKKTIIINTPLINSSL
jgi:hypothetical protein